MMRMLAASAVALLVLSGCGSAEETNKDTAAGAQESSSPAPSPTGTPSAPADEPPVSATFEISVPGLPNPLLVTKQAHPRGGFQLRVFSPEGSTWTELQVDGHSLIPFVATDVQEQPLTVDCADGSIVITKAVAHKPAGVAFAWDIQQTSYAVEGGQVTAGETKEIADNVLPQQLKAKYPGLVKHEAFKSCGG